MEIFGMLLVLLLVLTPGVFANFQGAAFSPRSKVDYANTPPDTATLETLDDEP
jgi:hypothetical protein